MAQIEQREQHILIISHSVGYKSHLGALWGLMWAVGWAVFLSEGSISSVNLPSSSCMSWCLDPFLHLQPATLYFPTPSVSARLSLITSEKGTPPVRTPVIKLVHSDKAGLQS